MFEKTFSSTRTTDSKGRHCAQPCNKSGRKYLCFQNSQWLSCVLIRWSNAASYDLSFCAEHNYDIRQKQTLRAAVGSESEGLFFLLGNKTALSVAHASDTTVQILAPKSNIKSPL